MALIVADTREANGALPHFNSVIARYKEDITVTRAQIHTGDYLVLVGGMLKLMVERKTWSDLAASLKDGRMRTQEPRLREMRRSCRVIYIIEGRFGFADEHKVANIPFKNLHAKLRHNLLRGLPFVQSRDEEHTAHIIVNFARDFLNNEDKLYGDYLAELAGLQNRYRGRLSDGAVAVHADVEKVLAQAGISGGAEPKPYELPALVSKRSDPAPYDVLVRMWRVLPGVGERAAVRMSATASIADVFLTGADCLVDVPLGRGTFGAPRAVCLAEALKKREIQARILAEIPRITLDGADAILERYRFEDLVLGNIPVSELAEVRKRAGTQERRIGETAATQVFTLLNLKQSDQTGTIAETSGP